MWTIKAEAADIMLRLSRVFPPKELTSLWPLIILDFWEVMDGRRYVSFVSPPSPPSPDAIDRMDEVMGEG